MKDLKNMILEINGKPWKLKTLSSDYKLVWRIVFIILYKLLGIKTN